MAGELSDVDVRARCTGMVIIEDWLDRLFKICGLEKDRYSENGKKGLNT